MPKNSITKTGESTEYLLANARAELSAARKRATRPAASVLFERAQAGEDFRVIKQFKANGRVYQKGELIKPDAVEDRWMIEHMFVIPLSFAEASDYAHALKQFYQDELQGREQRYQAARTEEARAAEALETVRRQLETATEVLRDAKGRKEASEGELRAALTRWQEIAF